MPDFPYKDSNKGINYTIYRHTNRGYNEFKLAYQVGDKRKLEAFADFESAKQRAIDVTAAISKGDHAVLTLRPAERAIYARAIAALKPSGTPPDIAAERCAAAVDKLGKLSLMDAVGFYVKRYPENMPRKTISEVEEAMVKAKRADGASAVYIRDIEMRLDEFAESFKNLPIIICGRHRLE